MSRAAAANVEHSTPSHTQTSKTKAHLTLVTAPSAVRQRGVPQGQLVSTLAAYKAYYDLDNAKRLRALVNEYTPYEHRVEQVRMNDARGLACELEPAQRE